MTEKLILWGIAALIGLGVCVSLWMGEPLWP